MLTKTMRQMACLDDGGPSLLNGRDELSIQPLVVLNNLADGLASHCSLVDIWVLCGGVVAPDDNILDISHRRPSLL